MLWSALEVVRVYIFPRLVEPGVIMPKWSRFADTNQTRMNYANTLLQKEGAEPVSTWKAVQFEEMIRENAPGYRHRHHHGPYPR
ncbi:Uncharacterised protein [Kluyvera cryocrescens]|uniref:Uncharacterized protein n=1 Tax=Kluyvera cryocrescens TaxID=580 RepID=A0A485A661_KLUCR|nr:Uncharacterised protein [Kluyvera cryocrescens]